MQVHELKTVQPFFDNVRYGNKRFELRKNDRGFMLGDLLILKKYDPKNDSYSGDELVVKVKFILNEFDGLEPGYCILSISDPI